MAREASMTTIDTALAAGSVEDVASPEEPTIPVVIAPGLEATAPLTGNSREQEATKAALEQQKIEEKAASDRQKAEGRAASERQRMIEEAIAEREREEDAFEKSSNATVAALNRLWRGTTTRLASIPMPGSLLLPLGVLLVFFFLLIPVNGHTRFSWLWLVLSGNAQIAESAPASQNQGGVTGGVNGSGGNGASNILEGAIGSGNGVAPPPPPGALSLSDVFQFSSTFTGVEGA